MFQVIITISDVNDRKPVFEERLPDESCYVITEFHDLAESVLTIRASDGDDPQTPNGQLNFAILDGNEQGLFRLESSGKALFTRYIFAHNIMKKYILISVNRFLLNNQGKLLTKHNTRYVL